MKRTFELDDGSILDVTVEDTGENDEEHPNKSMYYYLVEYNRTTMFEGTDLAVPRSGFLDDDLFAMSSLLGFISCTRDAIDDDAYFSGYTPEMFAFVEQYTDELSMLSEDIEEQAEAAEVAEA